MAHEQHQLWEPLPGTLGRSAVLDGLRDEVLGRRCTHWVQRYQSKTNLASRLSDRPVFELLEIIEDRLGFSTRKPLLLVLDDVEVVLALPRR